MRKACSQARLALGWGLEMWMAGAFPPFPDKKDRLCLTDLLKPRGLYRTPASFRESGTFACTQQRNAPWPLLPFHSRNHLTCVLVTAAAGMQCVLWESTGTGSGAVPPLFPESPQCLDWAICVPRPIAGINHGHEENYVLSPGWGSPPKESLKLEVVLKVPQNREFTIFIVLIFIFCYLFHLGFASERMF